MNAYLRICVYLLNNLKYHWLSVLVLMCFMAVEFCVQILGSIYLIDLIGGDASSIEIGGVTSQAIIENLNQFPPWVVLAILVLSRLIAEFSFRATSLHVREAFELGLSQRFVDTFANLQDEVTRAEFRSKVLDQSAQLFSSGTKTAAIAGYLLAESVARLPFLIGAFAFLAILYSRELYWSLVPFLFAILFGMLLFRRLSKLSKLFVDTFKPASEERRGIISALISDTTNDLPQVILKMRMGKTGHYYALFYSRLKRSNVIRFIVSITVLIALIPAFYSLWLKVENGELNWPEVLPAIAVLQLIISYLNGFSAAFGALSRNFYNISRLFDALHFRVDSADWNSSAGSTIVAGAGGSRSIIADVGLDKTTLSADAILSKSGLHLILISDTVARKRRTQCRTLWKTGLEQLVFLADFLPAEEIYSASKLQSVLGVVSKSTTVVANAKQFPQSGSEENAGIIDLLSNYSTIIFVSDFEQCTVVESESVSSVSTTIDQNAVVVDTLPIENLSDSIQLGLNILYQVNESNESDSEIE